MVQEGFLSFIVFLKTTLAKMVANKALPTEFICTEFWETWPHQYYSTHSFHDVETPANEPHDEVDDSQSILANTVKCNIKIKILITRPNLLLF